MIFKELIEQISQELWPEMESENLVRVHRNFFLQAFWDLQRAVPCLTFGNTTVYPHCSTYFNCGMTVLPKPNGQITRIYVIDRINPDTGEEDITADENWCAKVYLQPVQFCHIQSYVKLCERCSSAPSVADALVSALFGVYRTKRRYPKPTDEGLESLPKLPQGYHYPQASTDASGRSPSGVFALNGGEIFIAPWIQSTESLVVEYVGIKRNWGDNDFVEDDPKFLQAVRLHVGHQHESSYGDAAKAKDYYEQLWGPIGVIPMLIHQCKEENRAASCAESGGTAAMARGIGRVTGAGGAGTDLFYNERQEYTANCPSGQTGDPVRVVKEANTVSSALSVADANARALQMASEEATAGLDCEVAPTVYSSVAVSQTASCPGASGDTPAAVGTSVTVSKPAGFKTSTVSQAAADASAEAAALAEAESQLTCTYYNAPVTVTVSCPAGTVGADVEKSIAAGVYSSPDSQDDADGQATAAATNQANAELSCGGDTVIVYNTQQPGEYTAYCARNNSYFTAQSSVPAGYYTQSSANTPEAILAITASLNAMALALANQRAFVIWNQQC